VAREGKKAHPASQGPQRQHRQDHPSFSLTLTFKLTLRGGRLLHLSIY
jgi:hypothetical protein